MDVSKKVRYTPLMWNKFEPTCATVEEKAIPITPGPGRYDINREPNCLNFNSMSEANIKMDPADVSSMAYAREVNQKQLTSSFAMNSHPKSHRFGKELFLDTHKYVQGHKYDNTLQRIQDNQSNQANILVQVSSEHTADMRNHQSSKHFEKLPPSISVTNKRDVSVAVYRE
jgi:hypothetical protein